MERAYTELTGVVAVYKPCRTRTPGIVARVVHNSQDFLGRICKSQRREAPDTGLEVLQNFKGFRVLWHGLHSIINRNSRPRFENAVPVPQWFEALAYRTYRTFRCSRECPTDLTDVPSTGKTQVSVHGLGCAKGNTHDRGGGVLFEI